MLKLGLIDLIQLAVTLVFALPLGLFGLNMLLDGRAVGAGLLLLALLMVVLPHYLWSPPGWGDLAAATVGGITGGKER